MEYRRVTPNEADLLAPLNRQLILDEGHRNTMTTEELATRIRQWLSDEYEAVSFEDAGKMVGYALYKLEADCVYLRQLFVLPEHRLKGIGRSAIDWLRCNPGKNVPRIRIEVLSGNVDAQQFWRSLGFKDYAVTMESEAPGILWTSKHK